MAKRISKLPAATVLKEADEHALNQAGTTKKGTGKQLIQGPDDTVESLFGRPFRNPHKYITLFDDFNVAPEISVGAPAKRGWVLLGQNAVLDNVGGNVRGNSVMFSTLDMITGALSGDETLLFPASRIGSMQLSAVWRLTQFSVSALRR